MKVKNNPLKLCEVKLLFHPPLGFTLSEIESDANKKNCNNFSGISLAQSVSNGKNIDSDMLDIWNESNDCYLF